MKREGKKLDNKTFSVLLGSKLFSADFVTFVAGFP